MNRWGEIPGLPPVLGAGRAEIVVAHHSMGPLHSAPYAIHMPDNRLVGMTGAGLIGRIHGPGRVGGGRHQPHQRMRRFGPALISCLLLSGCGPYEKLPAQKPAGLVKITTMAGYPTLSRRDIKEKEKVDELVAFVNSLPNRWSVPWYGPPVGRVYFEFIGDRRSVGNFYLGPDFFGRDTDRHFSQDASRSRIEELGRIVDIDLWAYVSKSGPVEPPAPPTAAPVTPAPTAAKPAAAAKPATAQPTQHP